MYIFKILFDYLKDYKWTIFIYVLLTILSFPIEAILIPQIYSNFFGVLNKNTDVNVFIKYIAMIIFVQFIVNVSNVLTSYIDSYAIPAINHYLINYIFKNILRKYENSITEIELGKIIARLSTIPAYIKEFLTDFLVWVFPRLFTIILINIYFLYINVNLGLISIALLILFIYVTIKYFYSCSKLSFERHNLFEEHNQETQDLLSNTQSIYAAGYTNVEIKNYDISTGKYTSKFRENLMCMNKVNVITGILVVFVFVLLNIATTYLYFKKKISYTSLIAVFITILYYIPCITTICLILPSIIHSYGPLQSIDNFVEDLYYINNKYKNIDNNDTNNDDEIEDIKDLSEVGIKEYIMKHINKKKIDNKMTNIEEKLKTGTIIINNLSFGYNQNDIIFKNFYLTIKNNETVAILGQSGNGKSTLIKLIMGYYTVPNNTIFIDDKDINQYNILELRKQISYVNQNTKLFNTSILKNIQYGNDMTRQDINILINKIGVANIFKNLKEGLDTNVGVDGSKLSGGQRQIIQLLRNMSKDNRIVILDEPTSAIDESNIINVMNAIKELSYNKTVIIITHDNKLLSLVKRVIKINSGKIIEDKYINE